MRKAVLSSHTMSEEQSTLHVIFFVSCNVNAFDTYLFHRYISTALQLCAKSPRLKFTVLLFTILSPSFLSPSFLLDRNLARNKSAVISQTSGLPLVELYMWIHTLEDSVLMPKRPFDSFTSSSLYKHSLSLSLFSPEC